MSSSTIDPGDKSPAAIEKDVERTRAHVSGTLDELRGRLAPSHIVDEFVERVSDYARGSGGATFARNLGGAVRDNPLPILLIGAGVGWLMLSGGDTDRAPPAPRNPLRLPPPHPLATGRDGNGAGQGGAATSTDKDGGSGSYIGGAASRAADAGSNLMSGARESAANASRSVTEMAGSAREGVTSAARGGWESAAGVVEAHPLLLGLLGAVLGASLGAALPRTQAEDDLLGEASDAASSRVSQLGRETADEVRTAAGEHLQGAKDAAAEGYAKVKERLDQGSVSGAGEALGEAMSSTAKAAGEAASGLAGEAKDRLRPDGRPQGEGHKA